MVITKKVFFSFSVCLIVTFLEDKKLLFTLPLAQEALMSRCSGAFLHCQGKQELLSLQPDSLPPCLSIILKTYN